MLKNKFQRAVDSDRTVAKVDSIGSVVRAEVDRECLDHGLEQPLM